MKQYACYIAFFMTAFAMAQSADSTSKRFSIGVEFSPDYSYRYLVSANKTTEFIVKDRNEFEVPRLSFTTGLSGVFKLKKKCYLEGGIQYSVKGEKYKREMNWIAPQTLNDPSIPSNGGNGSAKMEYNYKDIYIDLPVKLNYYLCTKKVAPFVSGGISPNIFITEKLIINHENHGGSSAYYSTINPQALLGFGIDFNLPRVKIRIEPIGRCSVIPVIKDTNIKGYFYSVGINYGLYYRF